MELKSYLSSKFEGRDSFLENIVFPIFGEERFEDRYDVEALDNADLQSMAQRTGIKSVILYGMVQIGTTEIYIYDVTVSDRVMMRRNRVGIQQLIRRIMDTFTSAFIIFHYEDSDSWDWRFSFCQKDDKDATEAKRYTFLLGPGQSCRTAAENFQKLIDKHGAISREDIVKAFDVEALSKEFFDKYKAKYEKFCNFIYDNRNDESLFGHEFSEWDEKLIRDYVKKLLGRIVFLHFLQKKGWLGVPVDKQWGEGDTQFMRNLFKASTKEQKDNYLDSVLEPLFAGALNTQRPNDIFDLGVEGFRTMKIPYLNGGLFELDALDELKSIFPASYFEDLFEFFYQYNFTIDENDPNDAEVGIDPEMLGHIFENLLEDNKDKGAFYTPKEIVQYMCRESLIAYLTTCVMKKQGENHKPEDKISESVRQLLNKPEEIVPRMKKEHLDDFGSYIRNVKICDPAIGSGAFPMGLLNELVRCRVFINAWAKDEKGNLLEGDYAALKTEIISNNIYGVDIEKGAIDIARLRFWLSIIVDERTPHVLPNFDYKFMQGNSLIPTFDGKFINLDTKSQSHTNVEAMKKDKQHLYELKQQYYKAEGEDKHELNVQIKDTILKLISRQLGYESRSWYQHNAVQTSLSFDDVTNMSFDEVRQSLPEEKQQTIALAESLHAKLIDKSIPVAERSQIDIHFFDWRIMFTEVFDNGNDGFDIVIGNPPYIQLQINGGELAKLYENCNYSTFARTGDIYCLFYERGWQLLNKGGHLCYITSNKWMRAGYGEKTRDFFANKTNPMLLIDFAGVKIFESATVDTNILLFSKSNNQHRTICAVTNKQNKDSVKNLSDFVQQQNTICDFSSSDSWVILSPIEQSIKRKIEAVGTPLKDWDINIYRGVLTGCNEAFIITSEKREEILANCQTEDERQRTAELIRPILRGRDIKRYGYDWANLWLIYIPWHFPYQFDESIQGASKKAEDAFSEQYPAVYSHMLQYKEPLSKRNKAETGIRYEWYAMQRWGAKYWEDFNKPKIIFQEIVQSSQFLYDEETHYMCNDTGRIIVGDHLPFILGVLNSKIFFYAVKKFYGGGVLGEHGIRMKHTFFGNFPCLSYDRQIEEGAKELSNNFIETIAKRLDELIYSAYSLTKEEIAEIEGEVT